MRRNQPPDRIFANHGPDFRSACARIGLPARLLFGRKRAGAGAGVVIGQLRTGVRTRRRHLLGRRRIGLVGGDFGPDFKESYDRLLRGPSRAAYLLSSDQFLGLCK